MTTTPPVISTPWLRANEACAYFRISRRTLSRWQKSGLVTFARVGRMILFKRADLDKMVESLTVKANA